jgi:hypothetical protein
MGGKSPETFADHRTCATVCAIDARTFPSDNTGMKMVFRILVLASVALFVLPPSWCCFIPLGNALTGTGILVPPAAPVSGCCHRPTPAPVQQPVEDPRPVPTPTDCCCLDRIVPEPSMTVSCDQDATIVCWLLPIRSVGHDGPHQAVVQERQPVPLALHILHCVWLC